MVRQRVLLFMGLLLAGLALVPAINVISQPGQLPPKWWRKTTLFNMDAPVQAVAAVLQPAGISTNAQQVIVGHGGWLFLGDAHALTRTVARRGATPADALSGERIGAAYAAWETWLASRGVRVFRVMLAPNKETIYPEALPAWARSATPSALDALLAGTGTARVLDLRGPLRQARAQHVQALYYATDSHWNHLGAGVALQALARALAPVAPELLWPLDDALDVVRTEPLEQGDLARLLHIPKLAHDPHPVTRVLDRSLQTRQTDFDTARVLYEGGNPRVDPQRATLLVQSRGALNDVRVLWLRDSFGTALSPLMAATFSQTLQLHWNQALGPQGRLQALVEQWKPTYVFLTIVERDALSDALATGPRP